ncbi:Ovate protein family, C-terminal [Parasponia andersonii]|uniref:Transcription repressor n=1 Tax=Parasponia andersonii TaxID=3476 RepID=A0A2P5AHK5_PARAD|nr:Ovate protein family, C-terminal [Parasponia andersonii]
MPKKIQKSLQDYLSSVKKANPKFHFPNPPNFSLSSSKKWILWGCKHPKTLSFAVGRTQNDDSATLSDIDRFLFENFSSLYTRDKDVVQNGDLPHSKNDNPSGVVLFESPRLLDTPPNLRGTHRFFVNPGISGSLMEEARASNSSSSSSNNTTTTTTTMDSNDVVCSCKKTTSFSVETQNDEDYDGDDSDLGLESPGLPDQCVAVLASSRRPYDDFRRSMEEMVGARLRRRESVDWGFMDEILLCYLNLNEKRSHKYVLGAFVDLVVDLRNRGGSDWVAPVSVPARSRKGVRTGARERGVRRRRRARDQ